jgi:hypothetical protein
VEEKKWQTRKEALDALLPLTQNPKLAAGDYNDLVSIYESLFRLKTFAAKNQKIVYGDTPMQSLLIYISPFYSLCK